MCQSGINMVFAQRKQFKMKACCRIFLKFLCAQAETGRLFNDLLIYLNSQPPLMQSRYNYESPNFTACTL